MFTCPPSVGYRAGGNVRIPRDVTMLLPNTRPVPGRSTHTSDQSQQLPSQDQHENHQPACERLRFEAWRNSLGCLKASSEALLKVQNSILCTKDDALSTTLRVCTLLCVLSGLQISMEHLVNVEPCTSSGETYIHGRGGQ